MAIILIQPVYGQAGRVSQRNADGDGRTAGQILSPDWLKHASDQVIYTDEESRGSSRTLELLHHHQGTRPTSCFSRTGLPLRPGTEPWTSVKSN